MILTSEVLNTLATERGGYTKKTLLTLGVQWDSIHHSGLKGWKRGLVGKQITFETYKQALWHSGKTEQQYKELIQRHEG